MNDQDKIAEQAAEIANLNLVLAERKAKIAELMGEAARAEIAGAPASVPVDRNAVLPHVMPKAVQTDGESDESFYRRVVYNNGWNACRDFMFAGAAAPAAPLPEQTGPSDAMERIFESWDGCLYDGIDIGAALREDFRRCVFAAASPSPTPAQQQEPSLKDSLAEALHYPACWDVMAYPALSDALSAVYDHFKCSECAAPGASIDTPEFRKLTFDYANAIMHGTIPETSAAWGSLVAFLDKRAGASTEDKQ